MGDETADLISHLPGLRGTDFAITSGWSERYNCIAWAVGESHRWWSPLAEDEGYWPAGHQPDATTETVQAGLAMARFEACTDGSLAAGVEKIALFADERGFTHVARQLESGRWTSKLGSDSDIEHDLEALEGFDDSPDAYRYGRVVGFMSRPRPPDQRAV